MKTNISDLKFNLFLLLFLICFSCKKTSKTNNSESENYKVSSWITSGDETVLLEKQKSQLEFGTVANSNIFIEVDNQKTYQTVDGFGYTLTGGSAQLINQMALEAKTKLLQELFGNGPKNISISYLRISIGASDLSPTTFSYDDLPAGETDDKLTKFNLGSDKIDLVPILKDILTINPKIKILATPWSPPIWMKDNHNTIGGSLRPEYYEVYANYLAKYIQEMKLKGVDIEAITPQNEPLNPKNNPSMVMTAIQQTEFIKNHLGPAFREAGILTKIITYDHNCDEPNYPIEILNDPIANGFVDGSAFHLYGGDISALATVHDAFPNKNLYFTEQYTGAHGKFRGDLKWHLKNVIIGSMRNWSRIALEWNLINDSHYQLHTPGGCDDCKGAITLSGNDISRNVSYYIIAHISKFVPPGSVRIESNNGWNLNTVAFQTPKNEKVLIVENDGNESAVFNIKYNEKWVATSLAAGAVGTYVW